MSESGMERVAVIILNWNGEKLLQEFLPSVVRNTNKELGKVYVVDNHSTDRSQEVMRDEFPEVAWIPFDENYGFAAGYNRAIEQIESEYVVLLNSDVEVAEKWLEPLVTMLDDCAEIAAVQPKIKAYRDKNKFEYAGACGGYMDKYGFPFCRGRILDVTEEDHGQYDNVTDVSWCSGAAFFIRRDIYRKAGGLDERFFAHMEEIDLCWRIRNMGHRLSVNPASVVYHLGGGSLPMNHPKKLYLNYRNNLLMLYKNLTRKECHRILLARKFFDFAALMLFILKGEPRNVKALFSAYRDYHKMKQFYRPGKDSRNCQGMYNGSIIWDYYLRGKKKFSGLNLK